jgi:ketosteroid isomerase-like protein
MDHLVLQSAIERIVETGDFRALADYLTDDVEFKLTIAVKSPTNGEVRGKDAVIDYFMDVEGTNTIPEKKPMESFGSDERFVVLGDDSFTIMKSGILARSECAFVFDVRDGMITRLSIHQDLCVVVGPPGEKKLLTGERVRGSWAGVAATAGHAQTSARDIKPGNYDVESLQEPIGSTF